MEFHYNCRLVSNKVICKQVIKLLNKFCFLALVRLDTLEILQHSKIK